MNFSYTEKLAHQDNRGRIVCLGLDPDIEKIPESVKAGKTPIRAIEEFLWEIVGRTSGLVQAFKPNFAFFEKYEAEGVDLLLELVTYIKECNPYVLTVGDAKRGDIGNTNRMYMEVLSEFDAFTINPYLGKEANMPFLEDSTKLVFTLCATSNKGAGEFQDLFVTDFDPSKKPANYTWVEWIQKIERNGESLYERIAKNVSKWGSNVGLVAGATDLARVSRIREIVGNDTQLLIPGVGAQGATIVDAYGAGRNSRGTGVTINSSRGILYKSSGEDFAEAARDEIIRLNREVESYRVGQFVSSR